MWHHVPHHLVESLRPDSDGRRLGYKANRSLSEIWSCFLFLHLQLIQARCLLFPGVLIEMYDGRIREDTKSERQPQNVRSLTGRGLGWTKWPPKAVTITAREQHSPPRKTDLYSQQAGLHVKITIAGPNWIFCLVYVLTWKIYERNRQKSCPGRYGSPF